MLLSAQVKLKDHFREQGTGVMLRCPHCFDLIGYLPEKDRRSA